MSELLTTMAKRTMGTALIYCRVSTRSQGEGTSLVTQEAACSEHAQKLGYVVGRVTREVYTGVELYDRPLLARDRADLRTGRYSALITYATDRLARDPIHLAIIAEECEHSGAELIFVTEPLDNSDEGRLIQYMTGYAAKIEREKIRERSLRGRKARLENGKLHNWGLELYGYRRNKDVGRRDVYEPEAVIVRDIFRLVDELGASLRSVAMTLNDRMVPAPGTGKYHYKVREPKGLWQTGAIRDILRNPAYKGETTCWTIQGSGKTISKRQRPESDHIRLPEGTTPALVSQHVWERVQVLLTSNRNEMARHIKRPALLRGLIVCAVCGYRMHPSWDKNRAPAYQCGSRGTVFGRCSAATRTPAEEAETRVWDKVSEILRNPDTIAAEVERRCEESLDLTMAADLETVQRALVKIERQQQKLLSLYATSEDVPLDLVKDQLAVAERQRQQYLVAIMALEAHLTQQKRTVEHLAGLHAYYQRAVQNLETFGLEEKRHVLKTLGVRVLANGHDVQLHCAIPLTIGAEPYLDIPKPFATSCPE